LINSNEFKYLYACIIPFLEAMKQFNSIDIDNGGTIDPEEFAKYATKYPNLILVDSEIDVMFEIINKAKTGLITIDKLCK